MTVDERSRFQRCALASGLVTQRQIDEALAKLRWSWDEASSSADPRAEQQLAEKLVELGALNPWQAKQLLEGQAKFNLGPYKIIDSLGHGGMGHVYLARHAVLGREAAIKVLPRDRSTPEAIESFTREIRAQASLNHENLVQAFDAGHDRNVYYLVAEYVPGTDLRRLVRRTGPLSMQTAASIISQVARGLEHAHRRGLIHRDVKPGNVLVTPEGHAKLSDLGLAGSVVADPQTDPQFGRIVGTVDYLSPDHIRTPWAPRPAWDIYSLGCTLYFAVTGKVPFPGGSTAEKARAHCQRRPLDPRCFNPTLSVEFADVLADMMARDPGERIATAAEVVARLAPWVGEPVPIPEAAGGPPTARGSVFTSAQQRRSAAANLQRLRDTQDIAAGIDGPAARPEQEEHTQRGQITRPVASADDETRVGLRLDTSRRRRQKPRELVAPLLVLVGLPVVVVLLLMGVLWLAGFLASG